MSPGIRLNDKETVATVTHLVGVRIAPNKKIAQVAVEDLAEQMLGGPVGAGLADLQSQIDAIKTITGESIQWKDDVRFALKTNVSLAGFVPGAVVEGMTLAVDDRFAVMGQANGAQRGIWVVQASGPPVRAADADSGAELLYMGFYVREGALAKGRYVCTTPGPITIGTTPLTFVLWGEDTQLSTLLQTIGIGGTPVTGSSAAANNTYVIAAPVERSGFIKTIRVFAVLAGEVRIRRFAKSGNNFTAVAGDISVVLAAGVNVINVAALGFHEVKAGEYLGVYQRKAIIAYISAVNAGYYSPTVQSDTVAFSDDTAQTNLTLQIGIDVEALPALVDARRIDALTGARPSGTQHIGLGKGIVPTAGTQTVSATTFAFRQPVSADGVVTGLRLAVLSGGKAYLKRFSKVGDTFTQIGSDYPIDIAADGTVVALPYIPVSAGDYLGFFRGTAGIAFRNVAEGIDYYGDPFFSAASGNVSSFVDDVASALPVQMGYEVTYGPTARLDRRIAAQQVANASAEEVYYNDTVLASEGTASGQVVTLTAQLDRDGQLSTLAGSLTLTATTALYARYDVIYIDCTSLAFGVVEGTERQVDPDAFIPAVGTRRIPIYLAKVGGTDVTLTPLWRIDDNLDRTIAAEVERDRIRSRRCLPKTMARIMRGQPLRILGLGDSILALQSAVPPNNAINGPTRDRAAASGTDYTYLRTGYGADVVDAIPLYTAAQLGRANDGAGAVHTRIGMIWELVAALEARGYVLGTDLWYDNFAIGGSNSAGLISSGSPTAWLTNALNFCTANNVNLVVYHHGMNERGNVDSEERFVAVAQAFAAIGVEVLMMGVPRPRSGVLAEWRYTNAALRRAAMISRSAYVPTDAISDDRFIGSLGISAADLCSANTSNHPGLVELAAYGRELARTLLDA